MTNENHADRGLVLLAGTMIAGSVAAAAAIAAIAGGFSPDLTSERAGCGHAVNDYLDEGSGRSRRMVETALHEACGGLHAFLQREVFDRWAGTTSCGSRVSNYLRAKRNGAEKADQAALRQAMANRCRTEGANQ